MLDLSASIEKKRRMDLIMLVLCPGMLFAGMLAGMFSGDGDLVRAYAWNALFVELLVVMMPASAYIDKYGGKLRFGLRRISVMEGIWALLLGTATFFVATGFNQLLLLLFEALGASPISSAQLPTDGGWRLLASIVLIAVVPAVAEETLFRGALLYTWLPFGKKRAVLHTALLFALIHFQPAVLPTLLLLGLLLAHVALQTGSCYASMGMHMGYNLIVILLHYGMGEVKSAEQAPLAMGTLLLYTAMYLAIGAFIGMFAYQQLMRASFRRQRAAMKELNETPGYDAFRLHIEKELSKQRAKQAQAAHGEEAPALQDGEKAPASAFVVLTYVIVGVVNLLLLIAQFVDVPALVRGA